MDGQRQEGYRTLRPEIASGEGYRPQWETLNSRLQLDRPIISEEFGTRNRYYIRKGGELFMMSVVYLAIYLYHVYRKLSPLLQVPIGTDEALRIAVIAIATLFAFLVVAGIAMVRPAKMPMKKIREKYKTAWNQMRNEGLKASVEFEVVGAKREPKITSEVVDRGGRKVTRIRVDCRK